jgi:hypothetical protein
MRKILIVLTLIKLITQIKKIAIGEKTVVVPNI